MKIYVNNKETELATGSHISELTTVLQLPEKGIALAQNNRIIPRSEWEKTSINEGDQIVIIQAACGG